MHISGFLFFLFFFANPFHTASLSMHSTLFMPVINFHLQTRAEFAKNEVFLRVKCIVNHRKKEAVGSF